jgi:peptidoglycan hydrolase-like protein with peptidoglycan-binding domain
MSVLDLQRRLHLLGFDPGPLDGRMGPKTRAAIKAFQKSRGVAVDGATSPRTVQALNEREAKPMKGLFRNPKLRLAAAGVSAVAAIAGLALGTTAPEHAAESLAKAILAILQTFII